MPEIDITELLSKVKQLEDLVKDHLKQVRSKGNIREQLIKYGICPCECHTTLNQYSKHACCERPEIS